MTFERVDLSDTVTLYRGDCIKITPTLPTQSVHAIITDLPYGTTACKWDTIIPFADLWRVVKHVLKPRGAFVTTAIQPFASFLVASNPEWFKYEWVWKKSLGCNFAQAKVMPIKRHEGVFVFSASSVNHLGSPMLFNPQMGSGKPYRKVDRHSAAVGVVATASFSAGHVSESDGRRYPISVIEIPNDNHGSRHPTQKPVALYEYMIRTYTNEGDTVLDLATGSGTTGVACVQTGRRFVGIEIDQQYFDIAAKRISDALKQPRLFDAPQVKPQQERML